jgi:serine/threonine protein kinase
MIDTTCCPGCGCPLPADAPGGLCPECLLRAGLGEDSDEPFDPAAVTTPAPVLTPSSGIVFVPPDPSELAPLFPQLEIVELLGHGGMGAVYKARQNKLDRLVALKIIRPESAVDAAFAERFTREARTLARLTHAGIVGVHDFGEVITHRADEEHPLFYFVMEYVDGLNLRQLMDSEGLSPDQALAIVPQICEALQYAHDQGVIHRDIKPENILVDRHGRVKIADFGLARLVEATGQDFTLTATHQVMGTPRYMSPEQMAGSHAVDHRADIYSLGVVFYELLTGEVPMGQFEPPSRKAAVDARIDEVVMRALAREPERRFQSANELKSLVDAISSAAIEPTLLPGLDEQRRRGFSTIMEREAVAAWQWIAGDSSPSPAAQRQQLPALLMIALCLAGCLAALFPWIDVEFSQQAGGPDAPPVPPMAVVTAGYGVLAFQEGAPSIIFNAPPPPWASGRHSFSGMDLWPGMVFCVSLALLALLLIALPDRQRRRVRWLLLMVLLSGGAVAQMFLFIYAVEQTRFRPVDSDSSLTSRQNPSEATDTSGATQFVYFQAGESHQIGQYGLPQRLLSLEHRLVYRPAWMGAVGVSIVLLLLSATGVRHALTDHETGRTEPTRGRLPAAPSPLARMGDAPRPRPVASPVSAVQVASDVVGLHRAASPRPQDEDESIDVQSEIDGPSLALILVGVLFVIGHAVTMGIFFDSPYEKDMAWIALPGLVIGIAMLIGGLNLRYLWSLGWAQIGVWASFLPLTPAWLISVFVGISANDVLSRPHVRKAFVDAARRRRETPTDSSSPALAPPDVDRQTAASPLSRQIEEQLDHARTQIDGPAMSLLIVGILAAIGCTVALVVIQMYPGRDLNEAWMFLVPAIALGLLIAIGAWCMRSLRSYGMAMTAGVLCVLPLPSPALLITLPLGIWALVVLKRPEVREAFVLRARLRREQAALDTQPQFSLKAIVAAVLISVTLLLAIPIGLLYLAGRFSLDPDQTPTLLLFVMVLPLLVVPFVATILGFIAVSEIRHSRGRLIGLGLAFADAVFFPTLIAVGLPATLLCLSANPGARIQVFLSFGSFLTSIAAVVLWFAWRSVSRPIERSA